MKKLIAYIVVVLSSTFTFFGAVAAEQRYNENYAQDRAEIEDLQARYLFALDWQDADVYAGTFTEDGVLDWVGGIVEGREDIRKEVHGMRAHFARFEKVDEPTRPSRLRHFINNMVIKVDGDTATSRAFWFEFNNDGRDRWPYLGAYGHYEDELRNVDGEWLFTKRVIFNEMMEDRIASPENPAW